MLLQYLRRNCKETHVEGYKVSSLSRMGLFSNDIDLCILFPLFPEALHRQLQDSLHIDSG